MIFKDYRLMFKTNINAYTIWFFWGAVGVLFDFVFSVIGFYTLGIEHEKNPDVVRAWNNGTFYSEVVPLVTVSKILLLVFLIYGLISEDIFSFDIDINKVLKLAIRLLNGLVFIFYPLTILISHYLQGFFWSYSVLLAGEVNTLFYIVVYSILAIKVLGLFYITEKKKKPPTEVLHLLGYT